MWFKPGGAGGRGYYSANGGVGASSTLTNAVTGTTTGGTLNLLQTANGGHGGGNYSAGANGGVGGAATSSLTFNDATANPIHASNFTGTSHAYGGAGGPGTIAGAGGAATASVNVTGLTFITGNSVAIGGAGGTALGGNASATSVATATSTGGSGTATANATATGGTGSTQGTADGHATANTVQGQLAQAFSSATGVSGTSQTTATTAGGGVVTGVSGIATAQVGSPATALSQADINSTFGFNGGSENAYAGATEVPNSGTVASILAAHNNLNTALGGSSATIFGEAVQGAFLGTATGTHEYKSAIDWNIDATNLTGHLIL